MKIDCTLCDAEGAMKLVATAYGFTMGDKWQCEVCQGYVVTRPQQLPTRQKKNED